MAREHNRSTWDAQDPEDSAKLSYTDSPALHHLYAMQQPIRPTSLCFSLYGHHYLVPGSKQMTPSSG